MAIQNLITNRITDGVDNPLTNGQWQDATGLEVEDFVSGRLQKAIANFSFSNETSELTGYNSDGEEICRATVINATPNYVPEIEVVNLRINSNNASLKTGENVELNYPSIVKVEAGIKLRVKYDILGKTYYGVDPQKVEFTLGNQKFVAGRVIPNAASDLDAIQFIDITDLFAEGVFNQTLTASCSTKDYSDSDSYDGLITVRKIELSYTGRGYVEGNVMSFNISGLNSGDTSKFRLLYYLDGYTIKHYADLDSGNAVSVTLDTGTHQVYARVEYIAESNLFYSNWIQTNVIIDCKNIKGSAVAVINSVPTEINNCSNALLYKICYASGTNGGDIAINSYISEDYDNVADDDRKKNFILNSTTISLMAGEEPGEKEFYSYFELETVSSSDARFIGFDINGNTVYSYDGSTPDIVPYFYINVVENKYNINGAFNHTSGANLNYSQINGSGSNVFTSDNVNMLPGDGWLVDGRYTAYQVSASDQEVFKTPIDLLSTLNNGFTFEFLFKTYNVNGDDPVIKIGNLHIGPGYVRVHEDIAEGKEHESNSIHVNSKADFCKDEITHVLITYNKQYTPSTYTDTYNQLLSQGSTNYSSPNSVTPYDVLKIYVNGVINREIQVSNNSLVRNGEFKLQIAPTTSDVKFYGLRTYNFPFTFAQVQKNYISSILDANDKKIFFDKNDILDENGRISLKKCLNKYNVIVYAIPEQDCPLYYGNKDIAGNEKSNTSIMVHYANPDLADYNVKMWGGKYKAQGSSAKKYLIHNCQYNIKKGKCLTEAELAHNKNVGVDSPEYIEPKNYYVMPGTDIQAKKFVGKVNYASSMQTHKQGACDLFDGAYKAIFQNDLDVKMPTGGRKAVIEKEFLYFYYNLKPGETLEDITINDTLDDARFMGFQTWGPGKADDPTFGYSDDTPEYILMEGADNGNSGANFKIPWAAMQTYDSTVADISTPYIKQQPASVTKNDITTGLLVDDETIKFTAADDPLDVDYGVEEYEGHFVEEVNPVFTFPEVIKNTSLKKFVEFYNAMYQYDFSCYLSMTDVGISGFFDVTSTYVSEKYPKGVTRYKLYCPSQSITVTGDSSIQTASRFDVFRWDALRSKWVPAGLHMNNQNTTWETFNLGEEYKKYQSTDLYNKYQSDMDVQKFTLTTINQPSHLINYVFPAMKDMFIAACKEYTDYEDIAYHQAVIRVLSGTDNRAKNTYFQIIGKVYENGVPTEKGDYKVRLMQDDLDTIFATDNNGQQLKPYYLLEPPFNLNLEHMWGDQHSSFFYPFDLCFATLINEYTGKIINYLLGSSANITSESTKLHEFFLRIQETLPAIAYNHTAEIYYELAQTLIQGGNRLYEGNFGELLAKYANNSVSDPLSLSHGSNYEGEIQFLRNRLLLLASLTNTASGIQKSEQTFANKGTGDGSVTLTVSGKAKYLDYFYPNYRTSENLSLLLHEQNYNNEVIYDSLFANPTVFPKASDKIIVQSLAVPDNVYSFTFSGQKLTGVNLSNIDKYGYLEITEGLQFLGSLPTLPRANYLKIDGVTTQYSINDIEIEVYKFLPVIEELYLTNTTFSNTTLDFRNCNRLKTLDLTGCSGINSIILPEGTNLMHVSLPSCIKEISILNNPNLNSIGFKEGAKLTSLNINCSGIGSGFDVNELIYNYFDFSNATLLKLTGNCSLDISIVERMALLRDKVVLHGTYTILQADVLANISYSLKKSLVSTFGNIDSDINNPHFIYESTPLDKVVYEQLIQGLEFTEGASNTYYPFDSIYFDKGNDVLITSDGTLQIEYWLDPKAPAVVDATGKVTVSGNSTSDYNYRVTIHSDYYGAITVSGQIQFGYIEPEINFYAYIDGTFSKSLITSKKLVGRVFAKRTNPQNSNEINLSILGTDTVTGILGPDYYSHNGSTFSSPEQSLVFELLTTLYDTGADSKPPLTIDSVSPYQNNDPQNTPKQLIGINTDTNQYPIRSGKLCTYSYYDRANNHIQRASEEYSAFKNSAYSAGLVDRLGKPINMTTETFDILCEKFNSITGATNCRYSQILYPAFYKACLYEPTPIKTETVSPLYKAGTWYVPSIEEMSILIAHRIKSTTAYTNNDQSVLDWNLTTYKDDSSLFFNKQNYTYFDGFLKQLGTTYIKKSINYGYSYITSDVQSGTPGNTILYGHDVSYYYDTNNAPIKWRGKFENSDYTNHKSYGTYYSSEASLMCRRDYEYTVPLCCEITLTKK